MSKNFCTKGLAFRKVAHTMMPAFVSRFDVGLFELGTILERLLEV